MNEIATDFRVAVVGAGYMSREHIRAFQGIPGVQVSAIYSRTPARAQALADEFGVPAVFESVAAMYDATNANLVVVAVPELETRRVCSACFDYPWTVLVEKPAGYDVEDAVALEKQAQLKHRRAYVALNRRHYASTRALVSDLTGFPGPRLIKIQDQEDPAAALAAGQPPLVIQNWMYANSIHLIDYFVLLGRGRIIKVDKLVPFNAEVPRYVAAKVEFDSGDVGLYEAIWNGPGPWAVSVNTPERRWELRPLEKLAVQKAGSRVLEPCEADPLDIAFKPGLRRQAELAVLAASGAETSLPTLSDALVSMRLAKEIYG